MTQIVDLLPYVTPFATSVPEPVAVHYIRQSLIEFCMRTRSWRDVEEFDVTGENEEKLPLPGQSALFEIEHAWFRSSDTARWQDLDVKPFTALDQSFYDVPATEKTQALYLSQVSYDSVTLLPLATGFCKISMFLMPAQAADTFPSHIFKRFAQVISDGALAKILLIPEQPYTNPALAGVKDVAFNQACDAAFALNIRGQQRAHLRVKSSFF